MSTRRPTRPDKPLPDTPAARVSTLFADHHGVAHVDDLMKAGLTRRQIDRRTSSGTWVRAAYGVVRNPAAPRSWQQQLWVALLAAGRHAVVSHQAAAALHRFDGFDEGPIVVSVPREHRSWRAGFTVHSAVLLERPDVIELNDMRVTSATRTIVDLAAIGTPPIRLGNAIDSAARLGLSQPAYLRRRLKALGRNGRRGVRLLDELTLDAGGHSYLERRFLRLVREMGLPRPACQVVHRRKGTTVARVDFEWTAWKLVVEVSGRLGHVTELDRAKDARRRNELQLRGFEVVEFTTIHMLAEPDYVRRTILEHTARFLDGVPSGGRSRGPAKSRRSKATRLVES